MRKPLRTECEHCAGPMPTTGRFRRYCAQKCSDAAWRRRNLEKHRAQNLLWQRDNRERSRAIKKRYSDAHRDELRAKAREVSAQPGIEADRWLQRQARMGREAALAEIRRNTLKRRYGITIAEYDQLAEQQGGRCAMCGTTAEENGRNLAIDHDHACCPSRRSCGACLRGLLCHSCNVRLGILEDETWVALARDYLSRYRESPTAP